MFDERLVTIVQETRDQEAQLQIYQENLGFIYLIGQEYHVRSMDDYLQDAYIALGNACRLWDKERATFKACFRCHLRKAAKEQYYRTCFPLRVNHETCKEVQYAEMPKDVGSEEPGLEHVENVAMSAAVMQVVKHLSEFDQEIMRLTFEQGLSQKEVGKRLGVSGTTVHNHLDKIKVLMRGLFM